MDDKNFLYRCSSRLRELRGMLHSAFPVRFYLESGMLMLILANMFLCFYRYSFAEAALGSVSSYDILKCVASALCASFHVQFHARTAVCCSVGTLLKKEQALRSGRPYQLLSWN